MVIVSSKEFRSRQGKYLDMAAGGQTIILHTRRGSFQITSLSEDDTRLSKEELYHKIDKGIQDIKSGKGYTVTSKRDLEKFLDAQ